MLLQNLDVLVDVVNATDLVPALGDEFEARHDHSAVELLARDVARVAEAKAAFVPRGNGVGNVRSSGKADDAELEFLRDRDNDDGHNDRVCEKLRRR